MHIPDFTKIPFAPVNSPSPAPSEPWLTPEGILVKSIYTPDDLKGLDLKGKVVVYISGSPAEVPSALSAHYQTTAERWKSLREAGAIGVVALPNPASMDIPWLRS